MLMTLLELSENFSERFQKSLDKFQKVLYNKDIIKKEVNTMKKVKALLTIDMNTVATTSTCFHCPLKWECKKWFYYDYNVNNKMCDTVDETILFGKYDPWKAYGLTTEEAKKRNLKMC